MISHCQCMTPLRLITAKIILHALHNLRARKTVDVVKHTLRQSRFTLSQALVFSLSALYFKLNFLCESSDDFLFLDANADWYMLKSKWNSQKTILHQERINPCFAFIQLPHSRGIPTCFGMHFRSPTKRPRNAGGNIIRGKTDALQK